MQLSNYDTLQLGGLQASLARAWVGITPPDTAYTQLLKQRYATQIYTLFEGGLVNYTEQRPAGHWLLRSAHLPKNATSGFQYNGRCGLSHARAEEERVAAFVEQVRQGTYRNLAGEPYRHLLHLGIGGSDLGPRFLHSVFEQLPGEGPAVFESLQFVSNVDFHELKRALQRLNPQHTLVVVASKSFGTRETLNNLMHIRKWLEGVSVQHADHSLLAATCKPAKALAAGFLPHLTFEFSETVGGRYSLWGPVSLAVRLFHGNSVFTRFVAGGAQVDQHVQTTPFEACLPAQLALADHCNLAAGKQALMLSAYDSRLSLLVPLLQQLWMESLGKGVTVNGQPLAAAPCPLLWGDVGTNAQHAFFQMLHQSPFPSAVELLIVAEPDHDEADSHTLLLAHALAQAEAFHNGVLNSEEDMAIPALNYKTCPGKRPVSVMVLNRLTPESLGQLLAVWEYRTMALAAYQQINPFDQWGVELGKTIAEKVEAGLKGELPLDQLDGHTAGLAALLTDKCFG